jgi:L-ribulose-5-phosphate 3-epimerase
MFLGYNTNGLAHHELFDAVELLAEIGYRGVAITIDHNALPPYGIQAGQEITRLRGLLERLGMRSVIETGARFLLDPRVKHEPTLLSADRRRRIDFYKYAVDCAAGLGSD